MGNAATFLFGTAIIGSLVPIQAIIVVGVGYFFVDKCFGKQIEEWGGKFILQMNRAFLFGMNNTSFLHYFYRFVCVSNLVESRLSPEDRLDTYKQFIAWMRQLPDFRFKLSWCFSWFASIGHVSSCHDELVYILASDMIPEQEMTLEFLLTCVEKVVYSSTADSSKGEWRIVQTLITRPWNSTKLLWESESSFRNQRIVKLRQELLTRIKDRDQVERLASDCSAKLLFRIEQHYRDHNKPVPWDGEQACIILIPETKDNIFMSNFWIDSVEKTFRDISGSLLSDIQNKKQ